MAKSKSKRSKKYLVKPTEASSKKAVIAVVLTTVGVMLARGIGSFVPEEQQKYVKFGAGALGVVLGASTKDPLLQAVGYGVGTLGVLDGVQEIAAKSTIENVNLKAALGLQAPTILGLNCPGKTNYLNPVTMSKWEPSKRIIDVTRKEVVKDEVKLAFGN